MERYVEGIIKDGKRRGRKQADAEKQMQSKICEYLDKESHLWLRCNINREKASPITNMQKQTIEIRDVSAT